MPLSLSGGDHRNNAGVHDRPKDWKWKDEGP
jgi:hypothetical protein